MLPCEQRAGAVALIEKSMSASHPGLSVGIDIVSVARVRESLESFREKFLHRIFSAREALYAMSSEAHCASRLAARFAAKEAAIKALGLADAGVCWRDIEVEREPSGECSLRIHGPVRERIAAAGICSVALSMSHEEDYAIAIVIARSQAANRARHSTIELADREP